MVTMNIGGLRNAEEGAGDRDRLARMRANFADIASTPAMFGIVPNAEQASAALRSAAASLLQELERAGHTVDDIRRSAATAAGIGEGADAEARRTLSREQAASVGALLAIDLTRPPTPPPVVAFR
ncbi:hypothetical protein [Streptomyces profundus]|uniref:hypothetical protein n=1 Tax=Streptomyces profundus TaxID=2867410 RepID=UPI001D16DAD9|nr:hypothetical protein [Streptomyces sp. MA3_2.13]UED83392.1 hypothetical protein K4G22_03540 [Streptomyces sp. MA3_2.13]